MRFSFEGKLGLWDLTFWAERLKEEKYGIKEEELRCVAQSMSSPPGETHRFQHPKNLAEYILHVALHAVADWLVYV